MSEITKEDLIKKIERQQGWVDVVDSLRIIDAFTNEYGVITTHLSIETELSYMYYKLRGLELKPGYFKKLENKGVCLKCREVKEYKEFKKFTKKAVREDYCKACWTKRNK